MIYKKYFYCNGEKCVEVLDVLKPIPQNSTRHLFSVDKGKTYFKIIDVMTDVVAFGTWEKIKKKLIL